MEMKRVWLYCRIAHRSFSSDEMEFQRMALQKYAEANGFTIVGETMEYGNGLTLDRPGLDEIAEQIKAGQMDTILIQDLSRLARDSINIAEYIFSLVRQGVELISVNDGLTITKEHIRFCSALLTFEHKKASVLTAFFKCCKNTRHVPGQRICRM